MSERVVGTTSQASADRSSRGQSLVEFGIVLPLLLLLVGGIAQYGILIATSHTLDQVGRDLGRWVATQDAPECTDLADGAPSPIAARAHAIAGQTSLMGYAGNPWETNFVSYGEGEMPAAPANEQGVEVAWEIVNGTCPPEDSLQASFVTVRLAHRAPVVLPGLGYLPNIGECDAIGCYLRISTTAVFRMEPQAPAPEPSASPSP